MSGIFSDDLLKCAATGNMPSEVTLRNIMQDPSHPLHAELSSLRSGLPDTFALGNELERAVSRQRLSLLRTQVTDSRLDPYSHEDLADVYVDGHGLVRLGDFDQSVGGFARGKSVFEILPSLHNRNSSFWCLSSLNRIDEQQDIRIRLDPFMRSPRDGYATPFFKMNVFGRPLTWDSVLSLRQESAHQWIPDPTRDSEVSRTDAVWTPRDGEVHLQCEECPTEAAAPHRPARYFHTIVNKARRVVTHCDGAIRIFDSIDARNRSGLHLRTTGKIGTRIKVFQVDGELNSEQWSELFQSFFIWNEDVEKFIAQLMAT